MAHELRCSQTPWRIWLATAIFALAATTCFAQSFCLWEGTTLYVPAEFLPETLQNELTWNTPGYENRNGVSYVRIVEYARHAALPLDLNQQTQSVKLTVNETAISYYALRPSAFFSLFAAMPFPGPPQRQSGAAGESAPPASSATALCARVIDGDTIELARGDKVRYIGIDTPEMDATDPQILALAHQATQVNRALIQDKQLRIVLDVQERDRYGRVLAYVYAGGVFVNAALVASGYAQVATYPPNVRYADYFAALQAQARAGGRGLWALEPEDQETQPTTSAATSSSSQPSATSSSGRFVGSRGSNVYHYPSCHHAKRIKPENRIYFSSSQDARAKGYRPCKVCKPPG